jgi:hypothetical protein
MKTVEEKIKAINTLKSLEEEDFKKEKEIIDEFVQISEIQSDKLRKYNIDKKISKTTINEASISLCSIIDDMCSLLTSKISTSHSEERIAYMIKKNNELRDIHKVVYGFIIV